MRIVRGPAIQEMTGHTPDQLYRLRRKGEPVPEPVQISERCVGYIESELVLYNLQRVAKSRGISLEKAREEEEQRLRQCGQILEAASA